MGLGPQRNHRLEEGLEQLVLTTRAPRTCFGEGIAIDTNLRRHVNILRSSRS